MTSSATSIAGTRASPALHLSPVQGLVRLVLGRVADRLESALLDPQRAQAATLARLVRSLAPSLMGQRVALERVRSVGDARTLPITDYVGIRDDVTRLREEGPRGRFLFGRSPVVGIALTSGTTGVPKSLPLTRSSVAAYRRFSVRMGAWLMHSNDTWREWGRGKGLLLTTQPVVGRTSGGWPEGYASGLMAAHTSAWFSRRTLPSRAVLNLGAWEKKVTALIDEAANASISTIVGVPAIVMTFTRAVLERRRVNHLRQLWPDLNTLISSGAAVTEADRVWMTTHWCGREANDVGFREMYTATEGQFGFTHKGNGREMILDPFENFYQFIEVGRDRVLQWPELRAGRDYAILVTTPAGLINYRLGDRLRVVAESPLRYIVVGRENEEISQASERITASDLESAVSRAALALGIDVHSWSVWVAGQAPWKLILGVPEHCAVHSALASAFDNELRRVNRFYAELRNGDLVYTDPELYEVPAERFSAYLENNRDRGQFKPRRLFRSFADFEAELGR